MELLLPNRPRLLQHLCESSHLAFTRYFFKNRLGSKMLVSGHHKEIDNAIDNVIKGNYKRLIVTLPPGYTKTELCSTSLMARGLAISKGRARFMHLSYSHKLALLNSSTTRAIMKGHLFQELWPMQLLTDADSKEMWWTEFGGGVYASSTAGQVTGFRAGHMDHSPENFTGALILDDPVKPDDAFSDVVREGVNNRYSETVKSRLATEDVPVILVMQRIHYNDLAGFLLRGGSGEKWHHLNLPVIVDNSAPYPKEYTHGVPIPHSLPDGWLWRAKHNEEHETALKSHKRTMQAQYLQDPKRFDELGALWTTKMISEAKQLRITAAKRRTVVSIDPAVTNSKTSDATGLVAASSYDGSTNEQKFSVDIDRTLKASTDEWAQEAINLYNETQADAIVVETNNGGDLVENVLRLKGFSGRIIKVHASKGKFARAEPISVLYEQGRVRHEEGLYDLETELMEYTPATSKESPNRLDAAVWALTELSSTSDIYVG